MFKCIICETEFKADLYDDMGVNKCPKCGQVYNYDEGLVIELTKEQLTRLRAKENNVDKVTLVVHGDGTTDDTEALQAFLDGKADLVFPDGTPFGARSRKCIDPSWGLQRFHTTKPLIMRNTEDN